MRPELDFHAFQGKATDNCELFKGVITPLDNTGENRILHIFLMPIKVERYEGEVGYNANTNEMFWGNKVATYKVVIWCPETGATHFHKSVCDALINIQDLELQRLVFD